MTEIGKRMYQIPDWVKEMMPEDLINALNNDLSTKTTAGRTSAIDNDNVNDLAYFGQIKKPFHNDQFSDVLKNTSLTTFQYSGINGKYKCHAFLALTVSSFDIKDFQRPFDKPQRGDELPPEWYWYVYTCLNPEIYTNECYQMVLHSKKPINAISLILKHYSRITKPDSFDKKEHIEFFKSLSYQDKIQLIEFINDGKIFVAIHQYVFEEGDLKLIFLLHGAYKMAEYVVKSKKIDEFKKFIDNNQCYFKGLNNCHIIMPQFRELYKIAYAQTEMDYKGNVDYIIEHANQLVKYKFYDELQYMFSKDLDAQMMSEVIMKTLDKKMIDLMQDSRTCTIQMNHFLFKDDPVFFPLIKMGYRPNVYGVASVYELPLRSYTRHFEIIDYLPSNEPLDLLKSYLAEYHPELIKEFLYRFSDRLKDNSIKSWKLHCANTVENYEKACKALNVDVKDNIQELFESSIFDLIDLKEKASRELVLYCLQFPIYVNNKKYIKYAFGKNDLKLAAALIRQGADPNLVHNWEDRVSNEMYHVVMSNI